MAPPCDVILPVFNAQSTLSSALHSILRQSHRDLRLIVVDDGSTDGSASILRGIRDPRLVVLTNPDNMGLPASLNHAVSFASAPYVARMDADDVAHPERLARQIDFLERRQDVDLVGSGIVGIDDTDGILGLRVYPEDHSEITRHPYRSIPIAHPTWCGRREWFLRNPYDPRDLKAQDQALLRRALPSSRYGNLVDPLLAYRESTAIRPLATLSSRGYLARDILRSARHRGHLAAGLAGAAGVLARWGIDLLVWMTGNPRAALHRFQPLPADPGREWERILVEARRGARSDRSGSEG